MGCETVKFAGAGTRLSGTITCPGAATASPGVVLIGGSGPADRHNDGLFDPIADHLARAGVAVLAYDKRGAGHSTGTWPAATVDELAADAAAAVAVLRRHPKVAADAVGVLGHSEGGWVALRLSVRLARPRYLILNSCPAVSFADAEVFALTTAGLPQEAAVILMGQLTDAVRAGHGNQHGQRILAACEGEPWYPAVEGFTLDEATWSQLAAWVDYHPYDDLVRLATPALVIFGENDPLVPVQASIACYDQTASLTGRRQQTAVFPGADHRLRIGTGFAPGYLTQLSSWCTETATACH